jgi:hypothetical protein
VQRSAMGSKRLDAISDYARHGYVLRVDCRHCKHVGLLDPAPIIDLCQKRGWSRQMTFVEARLRPDVARLVPALRLNGKVNLSRFVTKT